MLTDIPPTTSPYISASRTSSISKKSRESRRKRLSPLALIGVAVTFLVLLGAGTYLVILPYLWSQAADPLLPGEQVWKNNTSSFIFGSNDPTFNPGTSMSLRQSVRQAGITLIRTPLATNNGTEVEQRLNQLEDMGAACLGILSTRDFALDQRIVKEAGSRCQMYEFGNEPDNPGSSTAMSASAYSSAWNQVIPVLRNIAPSAKFFGPVTAYPNTGYISAFLQATRSNTPDGVTYHMYPCTDVSEQTCLSQSVNSYASNAQKVRATVIQVLGRSLPLGVTEWNDNWHDQSKPEESNPNFMNQFTTLSLQSLMQGQVAFANQYSIGDGQTSNTPGGHLFMTVNGQSTPQLQAMAAMIAQTRTTASPSPQPTQPVTPTVTSAPVSTVIPSTPSPVSGSPIKNPVSGSPVKTPDCTVNGTVLHGCTGTTNVNGQACILSFKHDVVVINCPVGGKQRK